VPKKPNRALPLAILALAVVAFIAALNYQPANGLSTPAPIEHTLATPVPIDKPMLHPADIGWKGYQLIKQFEGYMPCRYRDAVGIWTIGWGHTKTVLELPKCINAETAHALLRQDIAEFVACVQRRTITPLNQNQFDALVSFSFNVGCGAYGGCYQLTTYAECSAKQRATKGDFYSGLVSLNIMDYPEAARRLLWWEKAGDRILRGLTLRREAERMLFNVEP